MLDKFKDSVKEFSNNVKSAVAEKELDEDALSPLLEELRLKLLQNNVSLEAAEAIEEELREKLIGQDVRRGKAEEKVNGVVKEVLLELLDDSYDFPKDLRNSQEPPVIFLMGFNGSGKCVSGDTRIYTESGISPIKQLYDKFSHLKENETEKGTYVEPNDLKVHSVSQNDLRSEVKKVSKLWKLRSDKILNISLSMGREVSVTPEHPFFSITQGIISKKDAENLSEDDYVMVPSNIDPNISKNNYWSRISEGYYINSQEVINKIYSLADEKGGIQEISQNWIKLGYDDDAIQYWRRESKTPVEVLKALDLDIPEKATFSVAGSNIHLPKKPSENLAEWLGMFVAGGNIDEKALHIHNQNKEFIERALELYTKIFGIEPVVDKRKNVYRISLGKTKLMAFLKALGYEESKHSLMDEILNQPELCQASFLKGLFSGDGHINKNEREIELTTADKNTANKIQFLLLNQGIISTKDVETVDSEQYFRIRVNGDKKLRNWSQEIGFNINYKSSELQKLIKSNKQYGRTELIPNQGELLKHIRKTENLTQKDMGDKLGVENTMVHRYENNSQISKAKINKYSKLTEGQTKEFLEKIAEADVSWVKVKEIEKSEEKEVVYDLTIPENHNFIANGVVLHNTTTSAKLTQMLQDRGEEVVLGAGDTFRAASIEQLKEHGEELDTKVISHEYDSDPAAVAYDAVEHAEKNDKVALIDTAGRSHSDQNLMGELRKMVRVNDPDISFLVIDALAGNDVLEQAEAYEGMFDAFIVTKMDVDENGGAIISISQKSGKPVAFIGTGQNYDEIKEFDKESFVEKILN